MLVRFLRDRRGGVAPLLALSLIPIVGAVGTAVDYSRAAAVRSGLRNALDSALLSAAAGDSSTWQQTATNTYNAVVGSRDATVAQPSFSVNGNGDYVGTATATVQARFMNLLGTSSIPVNVSSTVHPGGDSDNSCILTLDKGAAISHVSMLFGGAPNIKLAGCSTRSNTSADCNGHSGGAAKSIAAGTSSDCTNTVSYARQLPDIYASMASQITKLCGGLKPGATWTPTSMPAGVKTQPMGSYTEYHVCGTLTLSGNGELAGATAGQDRLIVVENGGIKMSNGATISVNRTTIILTGAGGNNNYLDFPNGNGQSASLSLSPSIGADNPWKGISLYQDPALTTGVANDWGPGATFTADGIVYLPYSDVQAQGVAQSNNYKCTKIVAKSFTTKGSVSLDFAQVADGCKAISMKQWSDTPVHIVN